MLSAPRRDAKDATAGISTRNQPSGASGHGAHLTRCGKPDRQDRDQITRNRDAERHRVRAGRVINYAGNPRPRRASQNRREHYRIEDAAIVTALENLGGNRTHYGGQAISKCSLRENHGIEQHRRRRAAQSNQGCVADDETQIADHPDPFASDAVRQMTERDLTGNCYEAYQTKGPSCFTRRKTDLDQVFRLMDLDGIPGKQTAEIADRQPPEAPRLQRPPECPIDRRPGLVDNVRRVIAGRTARNDPIGTKPDIFGPVLEQQVERPQEHEQQNPELNTREAPSRRLDQPSEPGQDCDRADADPREGNAEGKPAPADKPVRQIKRLARIGEAIDTATGERTQGQVKLPRLADEAGQNQTRSHRKDTKFDDDPRTPQIHQPPDKRGDDGRDEKPEREGTGGHPSIPAELGEDRWEQE